jgi:hypothetical protein
MVITVANGAIGLNHFIAWRHGVIHMIHALGTKLKIIVIMATDEFIQQHQQADPAD